MRAFAGLCWLLLFLGAAPSEAHRGAVATEHAAAADAGAEILRAGGNAVDAAIATAAAVCVVHPSSCGVGGGGFALVHLPDGTDLALDYRECAPEGATRERFFDGDTPQPKRLQTGGLAVGVPGEVAGWAALHARVGRLPLPTVLAPAIRLARDGFRLGDAPALQTQIARSAPLLRTDPALRATFLAPNGDPPGPDFRVVQADLARTLDAVAQRGAIAFYEGSVATAIADTVAAAGGVLTTADLRAYVPVWREPLVGTFRGRRIVTFPPPGSGGIVLEVLGILAHDDPRALGAGSPTWLHLLAGALAQGFADRAQWYGDPGFSDVPVAALLAPPRLAALRARLSPIARVVPDTTAARGGGTAHLSVVDENGGAVAMTTTINTAFGSGLVATGTGVVLNNEMDDFAIAPGVPNVYGLVGTAANAVAPGKRPQSSMAPTIVLDGRRPELVVGGSGGPFIISSTTQIILDVLAFDQDVPAAVAAPRIHDQAVPAVLLVEPGIDAATRAALARVGHTVKEIPAIGAAAAVSVRPDATAQAAGDRRKDGGAVVVR